MSRRVSRNALEPSPSVMRPATSNTLTSPTWRVFKLTLTSSTSSNKPAPLFPDEILGQGDFGTLRAQAANLHLIHERAHEKHAPAGIAQKILLRKRVRQRFEIETVSLVRNGHGQPILPLRYRYVNFFVRAVLIPVNHGVDHGFAHRHADLM